MRLCILMPWGRVGSHLLLDVLEKNTNRLRVCNETLTKIKCDCNGSNDLINQKQTQHVKDFFNQSGFENFVMKVSFTSLADPIAFFNVLQEQNVKLVYLTRFNHLDVAFSATRANAIGIYGVNDQNKEKVTKSMQSLDIDSASVEKSFNFARESKENCERALSVNWKETFFCVTYEQLLRNVDETFSQLQFWLSAQSKKVHKTTSKHVKTPLTIADYPKLLSSLNQHNNMAAYLHENTKSDEKIKTKRMLVLFDVEGWAFHRIALQFQRVFAKNHNVDVALQAYPEFLRTYEKKHALSHVEAKQLQSFDCVVCLWYACAPRVFKCFHSAGSSPIKVAGLYDYCTWPSNPMRKQDLLTCLEKCDHLFYATDLIKTHLENHFEKKMVDKTFLLTDGVDSHVFVPKSTKNDCGNKLIAVWTGSSKHFALIKRINLIEKLQKEESDWLDLRIYDAKTNHIEHDQMPLIYSQCDVCVCASSTEGTPNQILEAASCGVPFVSTDVGIVPHLVSDAKKCGLNELPGLVIFQNKRAERFIYDDIRQNLKFLHKNRAKLDAMKNAARETILRGGWSFEDKLGGFYKKVFC